MTTAIRDRTVVAGAVLRVWAGADVVGGAFLVAPDLAATSARLVARALAPAGEVRLDFPLLRTGDGRPAEVRALLERSPVGEVALLRLTGPAPATARMPPLRRVDDLAGRSFSVLGYPEGLVDGVWATGRVEQVDGAIRCVLRSCVGEQSVAEGFSGAPVWEARTGAVVGMAISWGGSAEVVPIDTVVGADPETMPGPYRGLRPFDESHADLFFGRDVEVQRLLDTLDRARVVAVAGPSGAGKSSLVRAGLVPRVRAAGIDVGYVRADPGSRLPPAGTDGRRTLLVVDQFEELAALDPAAARDLLGRLVRRTEVDAAARAVLTVRWTTLDELLTPELINALESGTVLVGPLDRANLREAIVRPAERPPGLAFEPGLVETVLDDAGAEPGRLPLVGSLLAQLWERREGGFLTLRAYEAAGGVAGAVAQHAETVVSARRAAGGIGPLRRLLTGLARPDTDGRFVRRAVPVDELPAAQQALIPELSAGRLLTVTRSAKGSDVVELAHQALIDHWPRLREWLTADREFLSWREQVGARREEWEAEGREDGALLRGAALARASEWLPERRDDVAGADLDYVRRSTARQRREVRRWRIVTAVVAVLTVVAAALTVVSVRSGDQIAAQLALANADVLGRDAQARLAEDPATAAQLALAAWREAPDDPQARAALARSALAMRSVERELPGLTGGPIQDLLVGGDTAVLQAAPHPVVVTGFAGAAAAPVELAGIAYDRPLAMSADGTWLAGQSPDGRALRVHDLTGGGPPVELPGPAGRSVAAPAFSPDGSQLTWLELDPAGPDLLRIRDLRTNAEVAHGVGPLVGSASSATLTTVPGRVVVRYGNPADPASRQVVRSLADGAVLATLPAGAQLVLHGAAVATCESSAGEVASPDSVLVTPFDGSPARRITLVASCGSGSGLSASGTALVERDAGRTYRITDLRTGNAYHATLPTAPAETVRSPLDLHPRLDVVHTTSGPVVVFAGGSALLLLETEPTPTVDPARGVVIGVVDGIRVVESGDVIYAADNATGRRLGEIPGVVDDHSATGIEQGAVWHARLMTDGWQLTRYALPTLSRSAEFLLPSRDGRMPRPGKRVDTPAITFDRELPQDGGRLFAIGDGVLTAWDVGSASRVGPPIPLGTTEDQIDLDRSRLHMRPRPGHPGQVAVVRIDEVQVWDVPFGRLVAAIPVAPLPEAVDGGASPMAFDATGDRLVVLGEDRTLTRWDVDDAARVGSAIPAPTVMNLHGFDADGYLVVSREEPGEADSTLAFVDTAPDAGLEAGSIELEAAVGSLYRYFYVSDDRRSLPTVSSGGRVVDLPLTAQAWRDELCSVLDRPFTPAEARLLPPGAGTESACRG
ncbi:serine protease [Actinomycetes bacterium KLBMP 9759]